jgi:glutathione S-transferase
MKLIIGNKNYSSWSLRAWLLLKQPGIPFDEEKISFNAPDFKERVKRHSPVGKVPVLVDDEVVVWDSLAIAEYVAEKHWEKKLWPEDRAARARARSICAEMHSGFTAMRNRMAMNCELKLPNVMFELDVQRDVDRIVDIWRDCRERYKSRGRFLFGEFTVADAYFAPVTRRFVTYGTVLPEFARRYVDTLESLPAMQEWLTAARVEHDFVQFDEPYRHPINATSDVEEPTQQ